MVPDNGTPNLSAETSNGRDVGPLRNYALRGALRPPPDKRSNDFRARPAASRCRFSGRGNHDGLAGGRLKIPLRLDWRPMFACCGRPTAAFSRPIELSEGKAFYYQHHKHAPCGSIFRAFESGLFIPPRGWASAPHRSDGFGLTLTNRER